MSTESIDRRFLIGALGGAAGVAALSRLAEAGPLNPPAGPIAPTGKTVQEIYDKIARTDAGLAEPRIPVQSLPGSATALHVISQPGSYYLTGNIEGVPGKRGIEIEASGVTLDLSGFRLRGVVGEQVGVFAPPSTINGRVFNGTFDGWQTAVTLGDQSSIRNVVSSNNSGGTALRVGNRGEIAECLAWSGGNGGRFFVGEHGQIDQCVALGGDAAIQALGGSRLTRCTAAFAFLGFFLPNLRQRIEGCVVDRCGFGILVDDEALVSENNIHECSQAGVSVRGNRSRIEGNTFSLGAVGVLVDGIRNHIARNAAAEVTIPYQIAPNNSRGPIVNVAGVGDISSVPNASHPWANFIY